MRLCQIAVGCELDDRVDTVSLLDLLHLFKSDVVFNNEVLRHHLFCIFQILAERPPTLFGVPKEKPLQLVDVEACIEPNNVFSAPEAEAGSSLLELGHANGKSLDVTPFGVPISSQEMLIPIVPELKLPEPVATSLYGTQHLEPRIENQNQPLHENPIVHEIPSDSEAPTEELAKMEADPPTKELQKEPDVVSVSVSHGVKKTVFRLKVKKAGPISGAEGSARSMEKSQGIVVRHDIDRGQTSSASVDAPQKISADAVSISNQNHVEEVNSCHDVGSRMTASIGSVKFVSEVEVDTFGKELQCTAESGQPSTSQKVDNDKQIAVPSFLPQDDSMVEEAQQKYASLQTLSVGKEKEKKKDKEKKEKKRKREDPAYQEKKRLKKEKKQKEKEIAKLMSSSSEPATKTIESVVEAKPEEPSDGAMLIKVETKAEPSAAATEARPLFPKIRLRLKGKAFNNP